MSSGGVSFVSKGVMSSSPSHALDARKKATKSKLVQTLKVNHTAQAKSIRLVFITGQTGLAVVLSPK
jgi:hypothetical protein